MPNKDWSNLNPIDSALRRLKFVGMFDGVKLKIELINGFELFNTRPYHNYETWSDGWRITDTETGFMAQAEDLDDAVDLFIKKIGEENGKRNV
tara:strand:- start:7214 stop:7492 length:279 start_codon:yes stop_codon:yes gene_type:complete